jgi:hypothetical protein
MHDKLILFFVAPHGLDVDFPLLGEKLEIVALSS